jgi:hypothetical protein
MEVRIGSKTASPVTDLAQVLAAIPQHLQTQKDHWLDQLRHDPAAFAGLEVAIHQTFQQLADQVAAGLLAQVTQAPGWAQDAKKK